MTSITDTIDKILSISYRDIPVYDSGNRLSKKTTRGTLQTQENYSYDSAYQVISVSGNQAHSYDYDSVGNREVVDGVNYTSNNLNQYTQVGGNNYTNDTNGNLINDGTYTFGYNYESRLISAIRKYLMTLRL